MLQRQRRRSTLLIAAMLFAACSSGTGKRSGSTSTTPTSPTAVPLAHLDANLGPCPTTAPNADMTKLNAGIRGLGRALVPITAVRVRMCRYAGNLKLVGERTMVRPSNAARFEGQVNAFPASPSAVGPDPAQSVADTTSLPQGAGLVGSDCPQDWFHVVTFASASQQVDIRESCGWVGNGVLVAQSSAQWFNELQRFTTVSTTTTVLPEGTWSFGSGGAGFVVGEMHVIGGPRPRNGKQHDQPLPGVVEVHNPGKRQVLTRVTVGPTGRFNIDLPVGNYELVGRPRNNGIASMRSQMFTITVGHTVHVDLHDIAT